MDPLFSPYSNTLTNNADDISSSLSTNLTAINLNVGFQPSRVKKTIRNDLFGSVKNINTENVTNLNIHGNIRLPLYAKNAAKIQEFIPRSKSNKCTLGDYKISNKGEIINDENKPSTISTFQDLSVASVPEFIPRGFSTPAHSKNVIEPEIIGILSADSSELNSELLNISYVDPNSEANLAAAGAVNIATYQENVNGTIYFYTAPLTQSNNTSPVGGISASPKLLTETGKVPMLNDSTVASPDGTPLITTQPLMSDPAAPVYFLQDGLNQELIMLQQPTDLYSEIPVKIGENYCNIEPVEALPPIPSIVLKGYVTSGYKASHIKSGVYYFMRRIHNVSLPSPKCNALVNNWKKLNHTNLVHLKELIVSRDFGDNSLVFVYDYYPDSETLLAKHFAPQIEGFNDTFSSDPNAPRPYSHTKNALLRQQHSNSMLSESVLWSYAIQLTGALRVIHAAGLSCRCIDPSKVIMTNRNRVRLSGVGVFDVVLYDHSPANRLQLTSHFQQEDFLELGKLLLALACGSLIAIQKENLQTSLEVMSRTYSNDIRNLIAYLLHTNHRRSILELIPMIGTRFYSQIDSMQLQCDVLENEMRKKSDIGKLLKLVIKLACVNEWPESELNEQWPENGDRYMLTLFRDYLYHQMSEDRRPWIDINQIVHSLTKLLDGSSEKICLVPRNGESVLVMSYEEMKQCFDRLYNELSIVAAYITDDSSEKRPNTQDV